MKILKPKFWDERKISLIAFILLPLAFFYKFLTLLKKNLTSEKSFSIPIICVGNIYIGGTGKTPVSIEIFKILKDLKMKPVILKKSYKNQKDEILLIKKYCEILVTGKREEGIHSAIQKKFDVVILDDGFQDFSIKKNINIICFNSKQKVGNGLTIPSGPLRQDLKSLKNCDIIFYNGERDHDFEKKLEKFNSKIKFVYYRYASKDIDKLEKVKLIAFAGIGNPDNFFDFLKNHKLNVIKELKYPDHYNYSKKNLENLIELGKKYGAKLITTEKDYLRIDERFQKSFDYITVEVDLENLNLINEELRKKIL